MVHSAQDVLMPKTPVGETVKDGSVTWNTYYDKATDQFEYHWTDGEGNSGSYYDRADLNWPFGGNENK